MGRQGGIAGKIILAAVIVAVIYGVMHMGDFLGLPKTRGIAGIPAPVLKPETGQLSLGEIDGNKVTMDYKYSCDMKGLVVNERHFRESSTLDKIAPVSAVLAWGVVAEYNDKIDFGWQQPMQGVVSWTSGEDRYAAIGGSKVIYQNCTDAYLIAADDNIREEFRKIKQGDYLHLTGYIGDVRYGKSDGNYTELGSGDLARSVKGESEDVFSVIYVTKIEWVK
ncbi:MAG: hypothetical protein IJ716_06260 [Lachnospiraceae bacterium]|nr:hypothetical protein [Lachnospiraceae bacterium]